ncbi:hypothetical protein PHYPSEUDO_004991 [Phytophthora pseudosyringae]|uniref:Crossover junction endonuclease MUS81-like HHH domain-containing protein n=1 Tax=Phytophthora pseudosyringae TaxID=221518 RepID=A0A8T1VN63_9STRA|nr:hypothetical protein PHYPSEUDO_004991 [Phytophthora pseudosyringae]
MSSREASKKAAKELLALCAKEGVKVPTVRQAGSDPVNAAVEAGTMLNATREDGEFQLDAALKEMIKKFGVKELASPKKTKGKHADVKTEKKTGRKRKSADVTHEDADEDESKAKKPRKKAEAACEANQPLADAFAELSGFEFKRGEKFKGGTWSKVAKAIRECEAELTCGKDALKLKGVGKSSAAKIDEFLETGTLEKLDEYRAGNM